MRTKIKRIVASASILGVATLFPTAGLAGPNDRDLPDENDIFWQVMSVMDRPDDVTACQSKIDELSANGQLEAYIEAREGINIPSDSEAVEQMRTGFYQMCASIAEMPTQMQTDMASDGVTSNIFAMSDWHNVSGLYFEKTGEGRISFTNTIDFMTYRFFRFMSNFGEMVEMNDGYISLNASMVPDMQSYGAQLTMFGLNFSEQPDIYVDGKLAGDSDVASITYSGGNLTFTAKHFSAYKAVAKGSKVRAMKISKLAKKSVKYNASKNTFRVKVKGKNLKPTSSQTIQCALGFEQASKVSVSKKGKSVYCIFPMANFSSPGTYPLTISIPGKGDVTKTNAFRVK